MTPYVETDVSIHYNCVTCKFIVLLYLFEAVKFVPVSLDIAEEEEIKIDVAITTDWFYVRVSEQYQRDVWHAFAFSDNAAMGDSLGFFSLPTDEYAIHELLSTYQINPEQPQNVGGIYLHVEDGGIFGQTQMRDSYVNSRSKIFFKTLLF